MSPSYRLMIREAGRDFVVFIAVCGATSLLAVLVLVFLCSSRDLEGATDTLRILYVRPKIPDLMLHFAWFLFLSILATVVFLVSRSAARVFSIGRSVRSSTIFMWSSYWILSQYYSILVEGRVEPSPSLNLPLLVVLPVAGASILIVDMLLPLSKVSNTENAP